MSIVRTFEVIFCKRTKPNSLYDPVSVLPVPLHVIAFCDLGWTRSPTGLNLFFFFTGDESYNPVSKISGIQIAQKIPRAILPLHWHVRLH